MPTFYFDCFDGERLEVDRYGIDLAEAEVCDQAGALARSLLEEGPPGAEARTATVTVRAQGGAAIYVARCSLTAGWIGDRALAPPAQDRG